MSAPVEALFQPFRLGALELPTRVVMAPMTRNFSPGGVPNAKVVEYYRRRAAAGVGLIVSEGTTVGHKAANGYPNVPRFYGEDALAGWKQVVDAVHAEGGRIVPQLWHVGSVRRLGVEPDASVPGYGPMEKAKDGKVLVHGMSKADIQDVIAAFAQAARDAQAIGMDGVEIHGAHGYLIDQFFWEGSNQRDDEYGGSLANRSRFAVELVEAAGLFRAPGGNPGGPARVPRAAGGGRRRYLPLLDPPLLDSRVRRLGTQPGRLDPRADRHADHYRG